MKEPIDWIDTAVNERYTHTMIRIITILMLVLAGLPRVGMGVFDGSGFSALFGGGCTVALIEPVIEPAGDPVIEASSCCNMQEPVQMDMAKLGIVKVDMDDLDMDDYCPMSGGECTCGVAPDHQPTPTPKAPFQSNDSRITLGLTKVPREVPQWMRSDVQSDHALTQLVAGLVSLQSHHEKQARLGIWRT